MGTVLSGLSLLIAFAVVGLLWALANANGRRIAERAARRGGGSRGRDPRRAGRNTSPMTLAFSVTFVAALHVVSGLIGYRLNRGYGHRWSESVVWWQVWVGLAAAALAVYLWRKGLRDLRSNVYIPELAGHDDAVPPSRRIERR